MREPTTPETAVPIQVGHDPNEDEARRQREVDQVRGILRAARDREIQKARQSLVSIIEEAAQDPKPQGASEARPPRASAGEVMEVLGDSALQGIRDGGAPAVERPKSWGFGYGEIRDCRDMLYDTLPENIRKYRNPRVDAYCGRWIRALYKRDTQTLMEYDAQTRANYERAALSLSSHGTHLVPTPMHNIITSVLQAEAVLRRFVQVVQSGNTTYRMPTGGTATVARVGEGTTAAEGTPTASSVLLTKGKTQFKGLLNEEVDADSDFNLTSWLSERAGSAIGVEEDTQICTSNGTPPNFTSSIVQGVSDVTENTSTLLTFDDFNLLFFSVPKPYRSRAVIMGGATVMRLLTGLSDGGGNRVLSPLTQAAGPVGDSVPGQIGTIYGRPVVEVPLAAGILLIGDPSRYALLVEPALTVKVSDIPGWNVDQISVKITLREDGAMLEAGAFRTMSGLTQVG